MTVVDPRHAIPAAAAASSPRERLIRAAGAVRSGRLSFVAVWLGSAVYVGAYLNRGWYPHDDGSLAQSAERVLLGELPHRDFAEIYTGGLTYLHAFAFWLLGMDLSSMRLVLFAAFVAWVPALFAIARRFVSPWAAALVVALAVVWSIPNYPAPMPSWYGLFFATFAAAALLRYGDCGRRRWLFVTGLACGCSAVVKLPPAAFTLLGVLIALVFFEQTRETERGARTARRSGYAVVLAGCVGVVTVLLLVLVWQRAGAAEIVDFVLPTFAVGVLLVWNELRVRHDRLLGRIRHVGSPVAWTLLGALVPVAAFLIPYTTNGALGDLVQGVLVEPADRFEFAAMSPPPVYWGPIALLPLALLAGIAAVRLRDARWLGPVVAAWLLAILVVLLGGAARDIAWLTVRWSARLVVPLAVILLIVTLGRRSGALSRSERPLVALLAIAGTFALVQFPFAAPIYFAYVVPLFFLALVALGSHLSEIALKLFPRSFLLTFTAFLIAVAVLQLNPSFFDVGSGSRPARVALGLPRAGDVVVTEDDRRVYHRLAELVEEHARGRFIYAAPDAPEVYFLTGTLNPTPYLFDFFEVPEARDRAARAAITRRQISLVVVNRRPEQSPRLTRGLREELERRFTNSERVGRFDVRWR